LATGTARTATTRTGFPRAHAAPSIVRGSVFHEHARDPARVSERLVASLHATDEHRHACADHGDDEGGDEQGGEVRTAPEVREQEAAEGGGEGLREGV